MTAGSSPPPIEQIRRMRADEWSELRAMRLAALSDAPLAFGSTYERELAFEPDRWQRWAADAATGAEYIAVAVDEGRWAAMARGSMDDDDPSSGLLTAVYVAPEQRGLGLGRAVSAAIIDWARQSGCQSIHLHVAEWNDSARRLYESLGFEPTGDTKPLTHDPTVTELEMRLALR